jgi:hypothetical protein
VRISDDSFGSLNTIFADWILPVHEDKIINAIAVTEYFMIFPLLGMLKPAIFEPTNLR